MFSFLICLIICLLGEPVRANLRLLVEKEDDQTDQVHTFISTRVSFAVAELTTPVSVLCLSHSWWCSSRMTKRWELSHSRTTVRWDIDIRERVCVRINNIEWKLTSGPFFTWTNSCSGRWCKSARCSGPSSLSRTISLLSQRRPSRKWRCAIIAWSILETQSCWCVLPQCALVSSPAAFRRHIAPSRLASHLNTWFLIAIIAGGYHRAQARAPPCGADRRGEEAAAAALPPQALATAAHPDPGPGGALLRPVARPGGEDREALGDSRAIHHLSHMHIGQWGKLTAIDYQTIWVCVAFSHLHVFLTNQLAACLHYHLFHINILSLTYSVS